ncbi:hypothetical protein A8B98_16470 [Hymenobacter sp. UV11]|nr:hypothetical protein A8B98_16470 [Hymenobacter sp. UV11]
MEWIAPALSAWQHSGVGLLQSINMIVLAYKSIYTIIVNICGENYFHLISADWALLFFIQNLSVST